MYSVYGLVDPRDNKPFYVGITDDIYKRFWQHVNCHGNNFEKNKRIQELRALNLMVIVQIYEQIEDIGHARIREAYWIRHFEALGYVLTNIVRPERELKAKLLVRSTSATKKLVMRELAQKEKPIEPALEQVAPETQEEDAPVETSVEAQTEEGSSANIYRLSDQEIGQFVAAYKACHNCEKALNVIKRGSRYRDHAREIIRAHNLRKDA
jgi:predicted GIY-YIG superfamily endonuclease